MKTTLNSLVRIALFAIALLGFSGCEKALEVNPTQTVEFSQTFQTADDVESAVVGAYASTATSGTAGCHYTFLPDLMAYDPAGNGEAIFVGTFGNYVQMNNLIHFSTNGNASATWNSAYAAINRCNLVLANLNLVPAGARRNRLEGEARFLRAYHYFNLARMFGRQYNPATATTDLAVPLQLTPISTWPDAAAQTGSRASVAAVYTQVVADLNTALTLLPATSTASGGSLTITNYFRQRADQSVARALLARVHLQRGDAGDIALARDYANTVIGNANFGLNAGALSVFTTELTREAIWELAQNATNNVAGTSISDFIASSDFGGRGDLFIFDLSALGFASDDVRQNLAFGTSLGARTPDGSAFLYEGSSLTQGFLGTVTSYKWWPSNPAKNLVLFRLAEMILIRAECNIRLGTTVGATPAADIAAIRSRCTANVIAAPTLADVLAERHRELFLEGQFLYDVMRQRVYDNPAITLRGLDPLPPLATPSDAGHRFVLPIPRRETDLNRNLAQNPGY